MSADIEKLAVFDSRIVQSRPKYAVEKGALSLTNAPFNAIAATQSQHTYNIYVPSENVYVDRALEWSSVVYMSMIATLAVQPFGLTPIAQWGRDCALQAFPLNSLCSTLTATINDTTSVINSQDVLKEVLRLTDYKKNRLQRTCPTMLDKYQSYDDCVGAINNPLAGYESQTDFAETPNGAFLNVIYTDPQGNALPAPAVFPAAGYTPAYGASTGIPAANYVSVNGQPCVPADWDVGQTYPVGSLAVYQGVIWQAVLPAPAVFPVAPAWVSLGQVAGSQFPLYFRWGSTEKLVLSPFVFSDCHEWDTGLFGINNIQLIMNLQAPSRTVRSSNQFGCTLTPPIYNTSSSAGAFSNSRINVQFLTPSLDVPLPPKSVVPYMEFPRYITQYQQGSIPAGAVVQIQSQTITLPQIPDLFIIYVKPSPTSLTNNQGDYYLPVATSADNVSAPLTVNFDNFSGLLSSQTAEQLYAMSVKNGLDMDWNSWVGEAHVGSARQAGSLGGASTSFGGGACGRVPLVGGLLVLKPSQDITLQTGQAPSLVGNFTFQFNLQVKNTSPFAQQGVQLYVITANSGFFESIRGSSRIIKGVLSEQDIISAPLPFSFRVSSKPNGIFHKKSPVFKSIALIVPHGGEIAGKPLLSKNLLYPVLLKGKNTGFVFLVEIPTSFFSSPNKKETIACFSVAESAVKPGIIPLPLVIILVTNVLSRFFEISINEG